MGAAMTDSRTPMPSHETTHWGARPCQSEYVFPHKRALLQTELVLNTPTSPSGEEDECGVSWLAWLHVVCCCEAIWTHCQIL